MNFTTPAFIIAAFCLATVARADPGVLDALRTDKARYDPGATAWFDLNVAPNSGVESLNVTYRHGHQVVQQQTVEVSSERLWWDWRPPTVDYRGYHVEVEAVGAGGAVIDRSTIALDVSSDWARFPRYGFLSDFGYKTDDEMDAVIQGLNRYHINGLQFYDWSDQHHDPLAGTPGQAAGTWQNIANSTNYMGTVRGYIDRAHQHNMAAMSYNLANGALEGAQHDGVLEEWSLYKDPQATLRDRHELPDDWKSDIYLMDPANGGWQDYLSAKTAEAYSEFNFDGSHIDTLGDRGTVYAAPGYEVDLAWSYGQLADAVKRNVGGDIVVNAVGGYGQSQFALQNVEFLYTEVWAPDDSYNDLARIVRENHELSGGRLNTVLAAYVNYERNRSPGEFNPASVLLADAVTFAFGGAHLELGEHMLANEYFPYSNLAVSPLLREQVTHYYDFLVAYQNVLRDGGRFLDNPLTAPDGGVHMWPAQQGGVAAVNKRLAHEEVFHLINFTDADHLDWRDTNGTQPEPEQIDGMTLSFFSYKPLGAIWAASPDVDGGVPVELDYTRSVDGTVRFELPSLKYWSMVVAEDAPFDGSDDSSDTAYTRGWTDGSNGGTGFGPWRLIASSIEGGYAGFRLTGDTAIENSGAIDRAVDAAWGSFANRGGGIDRATAFRDFGASLDGAGDLFGVTLEHGLVEGRVGLSLRSGHAAKTAEDYATGSRLQFFFQSGDANYTLVDGDGVLDTGIFWTEFGVKLEVSLVDADTYDLLVWRFDEADDRTPEVFTFSSRSLLGAGTIDSLALFQYDGPGGGNQGDVFFNHLYYTSVSVPEPATLTVVIGGLLALLPRTRRR